MAMTHDEMIAVIQAHKGGKEIQSISLYGGGEWSAVVPTWDFSSRKYRIKPVPKPDVVRYTFAFSPIRTIKLYDDNFGVHNLRLTFDGETSNLKSAEVL